MTYPVEVKINRTCGCGGVLVRKTTDQAKPLGTVACKSCNFTKTIQEYADSVQVAVKTAATATAQARKQNP